jgi:hypothetical protein
MTGEMQHYLPAALIGGFGIRRDGKELRKAKIVVRELASGLVHEANAEDVAWQPALYRLGNTATGVDPDIVDNLWKSIEGELPPLVDRLDCCALVAEDDEKLIWYAATATVRHPRTFNDVVADRAKRMGGTPPTADALQVLRVSTLQNHYRTMLGWRWRVLHGSDDLPRFVLNDRGWSLVGDPRQRVIGFWLPLGPRVGILGYPDDARLPRKQPAFSEHQFLALSWAQWLNATAFSDNKGTKQVFAHPSNEKILREAMPAARVQVTTLGPFRGRGSSAETLFD